MSERVSLGAAGQRLGAWEHEPLAWLRMARARRRRPGQRRVEVSCCVCGTVREVRPSLVEGYTHLMCGPCSRSGKRPESPSWPGMIPVRAFNVAGYFDGYVHRIAAAEERASVHRAAAMARAGFLNALGEPGS